MSRVFVTGATGFVGSRLMSSGLTYCGYSDQLDIRILSRKPHPDYETVICDLQTEQIPDDALVGVDTVFHLAGFTHDLRDETTIKSLYRKVNVDATVRLAELAVSSGVQQFVFVSSVKAGGSALPMQCLTESEQGKPEGVYGQTKREAEIKILEIGEQSGMHVSIVRPALVYGIGVKGNLRSMLLAVNRGWFPPLPETGNRRSMIHIDDLVSVLLLVAEDERANGEIFIATDGIDYSTREIYDAMRYAMGKRPMPLSIPKPLFNLVAWFGDQLDGKFPFNSYKMQKLLGDECYSSKKLRGLGFESKYTLQSAMPEIVASLDGVRL